MQTVVPSFAEGPQDAVTEVCPSYDTTEMMAVGAVQQLPTAVAVAALAQAIVVVYAGNLCGTAAILNENRVQLFDTAVDKTLEQLRDLERSLEEVPYNLERSPGFWTRSMPTREGSITWTLAPLTPYETLDIYPSDRYSLPLPSSHFLSQCSRFIRTVLQERRDYMLHQGTHQHCSCIAQWKHVASKSVLANLVNQALEQLMVQEASACLEATITPSQWDASYDGPDLCPTPAVLASLYIPQTPVRLLRDRDIYLKTLVQLALAAEHTIQLSTCYLFSNDPAVRYLFLDVLPYCVRQHGITIQVLVDLVVVEGLVVKSAFEVAEKHTRETSCKNAAVTETSFLQHLPENAPCFTAQEPPESALAFLQQLTQMAAADNRFQIHWWCARDADHHYRVKNHSKCVVFDKQAAIMGGSNVCPTLTAATAELDMLLAGPSVLQVSASFEALWNATNQTLPDSVPVVEETKTGVLLPSRVFQTLAGFDWADMCRVAILRSQPSSRGEDVIYRVVLGAIHAAESSIVMCMGHSNYPKALAKAFAAATIRGVRVQLLVNSLYSNDLRVGQRDLFLSLRDLLRIAPRVEVYTTTMLREGERPPFIHAKYVSIDGHWSAVGSWNVWVRSAFYEIEHEALIESTLIAKELEEKFELDKKSTSVRLETPDACDPGKGFCPIGCCVCQGFGPFFKD
jgi:phosphatidylserine/phosphatidylglycerophosphate/cardiolipin synthase-like enzyme